MQSLFASLQCNPVLVPSKVLRSNNALFFFHFCPASKRENFSSTKEKEELSPELTEFKGVMGSTLRDPRGISYADWLKLGLQDHSMVKNTKNVLTGLVSSGPTPGARDDIRYPMT